MWTSCDESVNKQIKAERFFCGAENVVNQGSRKYFRETGIFQNGEAQTDEEAYEGKYSVLVNKDQLFGFTFHDKKASAGDHYEISVWRKAEGKAGFLVVATDDESLYVQEGHTIKEAENGWELIAIEVDLPDTFKAEELRIYVWNDREEDAYFDNLEIFKSKGKLYPEYDQESLELP